jgi:transaldolase/glucose-6-phosphate isomerase
LHVLDSIVPAQIRTIERAIDLETTLFVVSSKSGTTMEVATLCDYFLERVDRARIASPGGRFVAITDPGTPLETFAIRKRFRDVFAGWPTVGGRYSALSNFGMVPAALMGLDVGAFRERAEIMVRACGASVPPAENPGVRLGVMLGTLARLGRDKLTFIASSPFRALGAWVEQLVAESTGKDGRGIVPVDDEDVGRPHVYGDDRVFVYVHATDEGDDAQDAAIAALEHAGHPVIRIAVRDRMDLGKELFRWEIATAVACSILGVHAFDQPDVEASKRATATLIEHGDGVSASPEPLQLRGISGHLAQLGRGDYFAICAYLERNDEHRRALQAIRHLVRDRRRVATTLGFGPRFLHSTGQLHKGGPASGVFLQVTADHEPDLSIPNRSYTFGTLARAQADGDLQVLTERKRRVLRVHLGADVDAGLEALHHLVDEATR